MEQTTDNAWFLHGKLKGAEKWWLFRCG